MKKIKGMEHPKEVCEILNTDETSKFLKVGKKTLSLLAKERKIPARKIGREWRFVKSALIDWVAQGGGSPHPCWEIIGCSEEERNQCEVYLNNSHQISVCRKRIKKGLVPLLV